MFSILYLYCWHEDRSKANIGDSKEIGTPHHSVESLLTTGKQCRPTGCAGRLERLARPLQMWKFN
jgi:hypothetical protein